MTYFIIDLLKVWSTVSVTVERYLTVVHPLTRLLMYTILDPGNVRLKHFSRFSQVRSRVYILPVVLLALVCVTITLRITHFRLGFLFLKLILLLKKPNNSQ